MQKDARGSAILVLFARVPRLGQVKSRLAGSLGEETALALHRAFLLDTIEIMHRASIDGVVRTVWFSEPWEPDAEITAALDGAPVGHQGPGNLGDRMLGCLADLLSGGYQRVVILGSDTPTLPVDLITQAVSALSDRDVVIGPAEDGGYYLLGGRTVIPEMFRGIDWGGPKVCADTVRILKLLGSAPVLLAPWHDVDTPEDLERLRGDLARLRQDRTAGAPASGSLARNTAALLARLDRPLSA